MVPRGGGYGVKGMRIWCQGDEDNSLFLPSLGGGVNM